MTDGQRNALEAALLAGLVVVAVLAWRNRRQCIEDEAGDRFVRRWVGPGVSVVVALWWTWNLVSGW